MNVASLAGADCRAIPRLVEPHLGRYLDIQRDAFCALNTAFLEDGAYVHVARGMVARSADPSALRLDRGRRADR